MNDPLPIPIIPDIHRKIYAAASAPGALAMNRVHTCPHTHCRAGWAIALAGEAGHALEKRFGWELAAIMIYAASDPGYQIDHEQFYVSNDEALEDMRRMAEDVTEPHP